VRVWLPLLGDGVVGEIELATGPVGVPATVKPNVPFAEKDSPKLVLATLPTSELGPADEGAVIDHERDTLA
jgi:hypothetical protein